MSFRPDGFGARCGWCCGRTTLATKYNRVRGFEVTGKDDPEADPFAPADETDPPTEDRDSAAAEPGGDPDAETGDTSFNFGFNAESETTAKAATEWAERPMNAAHFELWFSRIRRLSGTAPAD
jgi:hypothetical protein